MSMSNFTDLSITLTKKLSTLEIKNGGIYFTPQSISRKNIALIKQIVDSNTNTPLHIKTILEPSCGSCEYINLLKDEFKDAKIIGIEYNKTIYESIKNLYDKKSKITIKNEDYLNYTNLDEKYDLIIGNPPYYVMKKEDVLSDYQHYFDGRPNIFIIFIIHSLSKLTTNGILSFILPSSFINCLYYDKLRKHIYNNYKIIDITICNDDTHKYLDTQQQTIMFIIQNTNNNTNNTTNNTTNRTTNDAFVLLKNNYTIFNTKENIIKLRALYEGTENTLDSLGFNVNIGNVVWNQCKDILTDNDTKTRLIYNSDIVNQTLSLKNYKNEQKKNYINKEGNTNPLLVLNRGYGKGHYKLDYCLINIEKKYLIENHLICIKHTTETNKDKLIELYNKIIKSFNNPKTQEFIDIYVGNAAINTMELKNILPIYL
jgi:hypothetical protein